MNNNRALLPLLILCCLYCSNTIAANPTNNHPVAKTPLLIGDSLIIQSKILNEARRINIYAPKVYHQHPEISLPVLYMPDGGIHEDFLHIAGLIQIGALNWSMRPFILVGIENTDRKRDLTGKTSNPEDMEISPTVGGADNFRRFIQHELMPLINSEYRSSGETAIIGESLAGLFVIETLQSNPELFDTYIAVDPSLWWDNGRLHKNIESFSSRSSTPRLHLAASSQKGILQPSKDLARDLKAKTAVKVSFHEYPQETHLTVYHPAALDALRMLFPRENKH